jgi:hypothetical protein
LKFQQQLQDPAGNISRCQAMHKIHIARDCVQLQEAARST